MYTILSELPITKLTINLLAREEIFLPEYKGSTFRGGFGTAFKRTCCIQRQQTECNTCILKTKCAYAVIFESSVPTEQRMYPNQDEIPRPFVITPPLDTQTAFPTGSELTFGLTLFGKSIEYLPYLIYAFIELGNIGIGKGRTENRGKFTVTEVKTDTNELVYDGQSGTLKSNINLYPSPLVGEGGSEGLTDKNLTLNFLTPTRIKFQGHYTNNPEFGILIRALLRRISALFYYYSDTKLNLDFKSIVTTAEQVELKNQTLRWLDWDRYSARQDTRMKLGGFVGDVVYTGDWHQFLPILRLGEYTHVGKNCTFGLGKYKLGTTPAPMNIGGNTERTESRKNRNG